MDDQVPLINLVMGLRQQGIFDQRVLSAIERTPREMFVSDQFRACAYNDSDFPIDHGQTITRPLVIATVLQEAELDERHKLLEVGTGSGYQAAVLSRLVRRCYTIERVRTLMKQAEQCFARLKINNISTRIGDGRQGWPEQDAFDRIVINGAVDQVPEPLARQLKINGILLAPLTKSPDFQTLVKIRRVSEDGFETAELRPVCFVSLKNGLAKEG